MISLEELDAIMEEEKKEKEQPKLYFNQVFDKELDSLIKKYSNQVDWLKLIEEDEVRKSTNRI